MNNLGYFLVGYASEKLKLKERLEPIHEQLLKERVAAAPGQARVLASYEVSNADQIAAAMAAPAVTQPEPEHFDAILLLAHGTPDVLGEMEAYLKLVTGGRGVPPHVVHELQERYAEIGLREEAYARRPAPDALDVAAGQAAAAAHRHARIRGHAQLEAVHRGHRRADEAGSREEIAGDLPCAAELAYQRRSVSACA